MMAPTLAALAMGVLFGIGLLISGMTDPANVRGFLDVFGLWRPQLIAVLGVGMTVTSLLYVLARRWMRPLAEPAFHWPAATHVDRPLVVGAILFGAGWSIAGYCPGPALVVPVRSIRSRPSSYWRCWPAVSSNVEEPDNHVLS